MPKRLSNRLEDLENEIHLLLRLQKEQCNDLQELMPSFNALPTCFRQRNVPQETSADISNRNAKRSQTRNAEYVPSPYQQQQQRSVSSSFKKESVRDTGNRNQNSQCVCEPSYIEDEREISVTNYSKPLSSRKGKDKLAEAYRVIENLRNELESSKLRMQAMAKDISILTKALQALRTKYKAIKSSERNTSTQIEDLKQLNVELCRKLDHEMKGRTDQIQNIREKTSIEYQQQLQEQKQLIINQSQEYQHRLKDANERLAQNSQELHRQLITATSEIERLKNELCDQTNALECKCRENENIKMHLNNEKNKNAAITNGVDMLEVKISDMVDIEQKSQQEIIALKTKIVELERLNKQTFGEFKNKAESYEAIKLECEQLKLKLAELSKKDHQRSKKLSNEMAKLTSSMKERESLIMKEKSTLKHLVEELGDVVKSHKQRIEELVNINKQQEALVQSQYVILNSKDEQVELAETETEICRQKTYDLEKQIGVLKHSLETLSQTKPPCKCEEKLSTLQQDLNNARNELEVKKEKLSIKEKIINDQADTIQNLTCSRKGCNKVIQLQNQLDLEKSEKEILIHNIRELDQHKRQLQQKINKLYEQQERPSRTVSQLEEQRQRLRSLEQQVAEKQREWKTQYDLLRKEKEKAVEAARFATRKLMETVTDFQMQTESQKRAQHVLANAVQERNCQLRGASEQLDRMNNELRKRKKSHERLHGTIQNRVQVANRACEEIANSFQECENDECSFR